jgi:RNA polymerase sigma factor (sigma-70 family)
MRRRKTRKLTDEQRQLVEDNIGCAFLICNKMRSYIASCQIEDPLEVCYLKMVEGVTMYTPSKGKTSTFFCQVCRNAILREGRKVWEKCRTPEKVACSLDDIFSQCEEVGESLKEIGIFQNDMYFQRMTSVYDPLESLLYNEKMDEIHKALLNVSIKDHDIFWAHANGEKYKEIAERYGVTKQMVAFIGKRAEKYVRERLMNYEG